MRKIDTSTPHESKSVASWDDPGLDNFLAEKVSSTQSYDSDEHSSAALHFKEILSLFDTS